MALTGFLMSSASLPAVAQEASRTAFDKWRPKAGAYAAPGKNFESSCDEGNDMTIGEKSVSGSEWGCDFKRVIDLGPGSLKVEMVCSDYNLAQKPRPSRFQLGEQAIQRSDVHQTDR